MQRPQTASLYYLDGFAGRGKYQEDAQQSREGDVAIFGSPIIAVEKAISALSTLNNDLEFGICFSPHRFVVDFIFNDKLEDNLATLKGLVEERFRLHGWTVESREEDGVEETVVYQGKRIEGEEETSIIGYEYLFCLIQGDFSELLDKELILWLRKYVFVFSEDYSQDDIP